MTTEQNKQIVGRVFSEVMNQRNFAIVEELIGPEYVNHGFPGAPAGPEGLRQILQQFIDAFPDLKVTVQHIIAEGDLVATRGTCTGTHKGTFMGVPATGKQVRMEYVDYWKVTNGKCVENWVQMDMVGVMMQIGAMPAPAGAAVAA